MAYAAADSLRRNLKQLIQFSDGPAIYCPESYVKFLNQVVDSIQAFLQENYPGGEYLETEIRRALWRAEDIVESYMLLSSSASEGSSKKIISPVYQASEDLLKVMQEIESITQKMAKFVRDFKWEDGRRNMNSFSASSSNYGSSQRRHETVGLDHELYYIKIKILLELQLQRRAAVIHGMGGSGKTALAISFYNDPGVRSVFSIGAWVKISLKHCVRDILLNLLHTVEVFSGQGRLVKESKFGLTLKSDARLADLVRKKFAVQRYLVIVDCLCDVPKASWDYIKTLLPESYNRSRIILVNRMQILDDEFVFFNYPKSFLKEQESWDLLKEKVFGGEPCPHALEKIGKRIAGNCKGLPLAIITVGIHLAKEQKTEEYWKKVAESGNRVAYAADGEAMYQQLGLSYKQTPPRFRHFFLYMGAFPESQRINFSQHRNLWFAEGFNVESEEVYGANSPRDWMYNYFINRHLVDVDCESFYAEFSYNLHHAMWHFCSNKAEEGEFFLILDKYHDHDQDSPQLPRGINSINLRRLIIQNNVLVGIRKLKYSLHLENIRSLLFTAPYHPYPLWISFGSYKLLKVLNALSIRFYEFPHEILSLTLLRYLSLTLNRRDLPSGISKLSKLKHLIVQLHHQIVRSAPSYLPMEIWEMQQLMHLECMGSDLPLPHEYSNRMLPNLLSLLDVSPHSCRKEVLERIPKLKELRISINLAPQNDAPPLRPFDHLLLLAEVALLTCKITNPYFEGNRYRTQVVAMPKTVSVFMDSLVNLTLSGCGFPWESIKHISNLPFLEVLNLQCHAFRGPKWEITNGGFKRLKHLLLEDLDLVYWTSTSGDHFFPCLVKLSIGWCHKLQEITLHFVHCLKLAIIVVVDSSSAVETWAQSTHVQHSRKDKQRVVILNAKGSRKGTQTVVVNSKGEPIVID